MAAHQISGGIQKVMREKMDIRGTQTEKNLIQAFTGESQAAARYVFFASQARDEGLAAAARVFEEIASQEQEHAKTFFSYFQGGKVSLTMTLSASGIAETQKNIRNAVRAEKEEWSELYPRFAEEARSEGFDELANRFQSIAFCERRHEMRLARLLCELEGGMFFHAESPVKWHCLKCGYVQSEKEAPKVCPACGSPRGFFERLSE